ncbi:MAG: TIGR02996 domain-containing protein [Planctomycetes bacterium]|jgi:uncharacterized protein (TIGR02996 family)|nr:TIGR02996 domain-containing protein [Planctomycetota bacterium]
MTHPQRFLTPILAQPNDDEPRLAYANWLDACGNPLGEFIRLQCPSAFGRDERPRLMRERRAQELLAEHRAGWAKTLAGRVRWCSFHRGFVEEIALTDKQWAQHAPELFRHAPVQDVHLHWLGARLDKLPAVPTGSPTIFLDLSSQRLGNRNLADLAESELLLQTHGLNLASNNVNDDGLQALYDSPHLDRLRELYLADNPITDDGIRGFVLSPIVERLDVLDVRFTHISPEGIDVLRRILGRKLLFGNSFA